MNANEIRKKFLEFQEARGHKVIQPAPLVLEGDPTTLFTGSGMQPLLPYLLGEPHKDGTRLCDSQPSMRMQDIDEVGDPRHTTVFEMLGNWSLGDYFKEEQIRNFFELLTSVVGLDPERIYVTCFIGNEKYGIPKDTETAKIWQKVFEEMGIEAKIAEIGEAARGDEAKGFSFMMTMKTGGRAGVGVKLPQLVTPVGQTQKYFTTLGPICKMRQNTGKHIQRATGPDLWK